MPTRETHFFGPYGKPYQGIYQESETKKFPLGTRYFAGDGRVFRYAQAGATALIAGNTQEQSPFGGASTEIQATEAVAVAAAVGDTRLYVTAVTTAQAANLFEDGWVAVWDATTAGMCYLYGIKSHPAILATGTASYIDLYDPIHIALVTSDQTFLIVNPYKDLVIAAAAGAGAVMGVAPISVTAAYYFWLQTYGPCAVYPEAALDVDEDVVRSDATAGCVCKRASGAEGQVLGYALHIGTAAEAAIVHLTLAA
jgi:hypothetical protein